MKWFALLLALLLLLSGCQSSAPVPDAAPTPTATTGPTQPPTPEPTQPPSAPTPTPEAVPACTISITCVDVLEHLEELDADLREWIPADGTILSPVSVELSDGETVFDLLQRVCQAQGIHLEFSITPAYDSAYIEGIYNLYETDCGPLSGWSYTVNEVSPNYACSQYTLEPGDVVCWAYHCDQIAP